MITRIFNKDSQSLFFFYCETDNGGGNAGNNYPLRGGKGGFYDGGIRAAGFIASPFLDTTGQNYTGLIHVTDWFPTLVNQAGGDGSDLELDGFDVWDSLR